jgi:hypothetical protein
MVRWCDGPPPVEGRGALVISTNAPDTPSFTVILQREPPPGTCPAGS